MASTPDPVAEAAEYQSFILGKLGDDDPVPVQASTPGELRDLIKQAGDRVRTRPAEGEWSVLEVAGHILDCEVACTARYRFIVAHDEPKLIGYDQDLWVSRLRHNDADPEELLSFFEALRRANLDLWARSSDEERQRVGLHEERGPESFELLFRLIGGHDRNHVEQARQTLAAVLSG